jgi:YVTN family beta-propeller protein
VGITSDSRWAVVCGNNSNSVIILDLENDVVATEIPVGTRPATVTISADDAYAYVGNVLNNTISVIELNGENSQQVTQIPSGEIGIVWAAYGVLSDVAVSPNGSYVLVAASFDDQVRVIETQTFTIIATLAVGDFPIEIAFADSDDYAIVTNYFSDNFSVLHLDGAASEVVGTFPCGDGPLRLAYDRVNDLMGIGVYGAMQVKRVNPRTGQIMSTASFSSYGSVMQLAYDNQGNEIVLTAGQGNTPPTLHKGITHTPLPAYPAYFDLLANGSLAAVAIPGPDIISVVEWDVENAVSLSPSIVQDFGITGAYPNPFNPSIAVRYDLARDEAISIQAYDVLGRKVSSLFSGNQTRGKHELIWNARDLPSGAYWIQLNAAERKDVRKVVLVK